jgi:ribosomal protein L37AE/L43A
MALYKNGTYLQQSTHAAFDTIHNPGASTPHSGIYRCEGCGHEIASNANNPLPPQNHHQHSTSQGSIRWRLIVYAQTSK